MDGFLFVILVAALAVVGVGFGLALAPRLARWDERRNRPAEDDAVDEGEGDEHD